MPTIHIRTIPHSEQRYDTVGDYWTDADGVEQFRISSMSNADYEFLVALHELVESHLAAKRGIAEPAITEFDQWFEVERERGRFSEDAEPGDHPEAPYRREHQFATLIERLMAYELGVDWASYDQAVMSLY